MTNQDKAELREYKLELSKLLYLLAVAGDSNSFVRKHFSNNEEVNLVNKKHWREFIAKYTNIIEAL
jgi:hypothetical protein